MISWEARAARVPGAPGRPIRAAAVRVALVALCAACLAGPWADEARAQGVDKTCLLSLTRLDHTTTNALALDTNAVYWIVPYAAVAGTRLRIEGEFPHARYIGFNVYDPTGRPEDAIADLQIEPDAESTNPFLPGANREAARRSYTLFVEPGEPPPDPAPNTLYTRGSVAGTVWYRVYIPDENRDAKGGVPLPRVTLELDSSEGGSPGVEACRELQAPYLDGLAALIAGLPGVPVLDATAYPGRNPPSWRLFVNLAKAAVDILLDNETGEALHGSAHELAPDGAGYFANRDISYIFAPTSRAHGEVLLLRGKAPTFADTRHGPPQTPSGEDTRYWSLCQYEPATQRVIACLADDQIPLDDEGFFNVAVSNASQRPHNARPECGFGWLPWGPTTQGLLIYRHMLADPGFDGAIANIPAPGLERETLGEYHPQSTYLPGRFAFEALGCPATTG